VTGLVVRNTGGHFTVFGQGVILALVQCGGLGIMLFGTVLGLLVGKALSLRQTDTLGQIVPAEGIGKLARVAVFVILVTFALEILGAVAMYPMFTQAMDTHGQPLSQAGAVWHSIFHSVSSFCNAGFALYAKNMMQGVRDGWAVPSLRSHWQIMGVMAPLIVLGGLGFPVLQDVVRSLIGWVKRLIRRLRMRNATVPTVPGGRRLMLHSKIVLTVSLVLILLGAVVLLAIEPGGSPAGRIGRHGLGNPEYSRNDWQRMAWPQRIKEAFFQSITARTAGFNTLNMAELSDGGKLWMCLLMIVGGSPASTAGGMKTVPFAMLIIVAWCQLKRRREVEAFHRSISLTVVGRAVTIGVLYAGLLAVILLLLCLAQGSGYRFIDLLFEVCSACGTVGLSTGITGSLSVMGKCVIIAGMFIGRLGPLTLVAALMSRARHIDYAYPAENVIIG